MEKLEEDSAAKFINALIKSVQTLCHGYLDFNNGIEIIGHINLNVDKGSSMHYILEEKVCKNEENSTLFISNSFHAQSQKSDAKSKGKDSDSQVGSKGEEKTSASDLGEAGKLSAISSISSALSKSHEKNRLGSTSSAKDSENVHSRPSSTAKRKASDDHHSNDVRAAKSSHLSSSPSPVSHFLAHSPHDPSASPSPADSKPSLRHLHSEDSGTVLPQTAAVTSDGAGDLGVNLAGSVLERVDDQSNSDLQDRGEDSDGDLEVTFIKEEYVEGEQLPCQFDNTGGQQYGRGTHQRASSSDMSDGSMFPVSLHHSQSASSTFIPSAHDMAAAQHYGPSTSGQPQPGTSGVRGSQGQFRPFSSPGQLAPRVKSQSQADCRGGMQKQWAIPGSGLPRRESVTAQGKVLAGDALQPQQWRAEQSGGNLHSGTSSDPAVSLLGYDPDKPGSLYKCEFCGAQFKTAHGFKGHVRKNHSNDPNFRCELCGKGFLMKGHYEGHMNMHNNIRAFCCPKCPRRFAYKSSLNAHVKFCVGAGDQGPGTDTYWDNAGTD